MAHRPVGAASSFSFSAGTATTSSSFSVQSSVMRVVAINAPAHVLISGNPSATAADYYVPANSSATLALTKASNRVVGVTTGATTVVIVPEGTQVPFGVGDYVTLTGSTYHDFEHKEVLSVNTTSNYEGYFQTRMTVDHDSSGIVTAFSNEDASVINSLKVSAFGSGSGALHYQQVQISGNA